MMMPRRRGRVMSRYVSEGCPNGVDNRSGRLVSVSNHRW